MGVETLLKVLMIAAFIVCLLAAFASVTAFLGTTLGWWGEAFDGADSWQQITRYNEATPPAGLFSPSGAAVALLAIGNPGFGGYSNESWIGVLMVEVVTILVSLFAVRFLLRIVFGG